MQKLPDIFPAITETCLILIVIFGPMAFGSVEPWAYSILCVLAFTSLAAAILHDLQSGRPLSAFSPVVIVGLLGMILVILQLIPWPAELLDRLQSESLFIYRLEEKFDQQLPSYITPSFYQHATRVSLLKLGAYVALFGAVYSFVKDRPRSVNRILIAVVTTGFVASMFAILQKLAGTDDIFFLRSIRRGTPTGPFVSRNQFAAYAAICFFAGLGLLMARGSHTLSWFRRSKLKRQLPQSRQMQNILLGFAVAITGAAVVWSVSRGGIISFILAGLTVLILLAVGGYAGRKSIYLLSVLLVTFGFLTWLGWEPVMERLETLGVVVHQPEIEGRYERWIHTWEMVQKFPLLGTGAGAYISVFPAFTTLSYGTAVRNPHNEYLGILADAGFIGLGLALLALCFILTRILRGLRRSNDVYTLALLAGGAGAVFSVSYHSVVDFPLRSPGIVTTLVVLSAILYRLAAPIAASGGYQQDGSEGDLNPNSPHKQKGSEGIKPSSIVKGVMAALILSGWLFACRTALGELQGQLERNRIERTRENLQEGTQNANAFIDGARQAIESFSPRNARLYSDLAFFASRAAVTVKGEGKMDLQLAEKALELHETAARLEPARASHRIELAVGYIALGRPDIAWKHTKLAAELRPRDPWVRLELAEIFIDFGLSVPAREMLDEANLLARQNDDEKALRKIERLKSDIR